MATSCFAIVLAFGICLALSNVFGDWWGYYPGYVDEVVDHSFAGLIVSTVPASILEPFETNSPVPLVLLAVIAAYALCHASVNFNQLRTAIDAFYELFSWMLRAVMVVLPFFCFVAFLDALLDLGFVTLLYILRTVLAIAGSTLFLFASYAIRLRVKGVKLRPFIKKLLPLLRENVAINS